VQGFCPAVGGSGGLEIGNQPFEQGRALKIHYSRLGAEPAAFLTPVFASPDVTRMRTYELMATPLVYPGQNLRARVIADKRNSGATRVALRILVYGRHDELRAMDSDPVALAPGVEAALRWRLPDMGGQPIQSIGLALSSPGAKQDGAIVLDSMRWDGPPDMRLRRPDEPSDFWRRAWVNGVSSFSTRFPQAFRISQDRGEGMIIHGGRQWTDYRVETALTIHRAQYAGVGVRVKGLRRYYAALLDRTGVFRIVRAYDGSVTTLAEMKFEWRFEERYEIAVQVTCDSIAASVGDKNLEARDGDLHALRDGGVALIVSEGACSTDEVRVTPPRRRR
jgi:hypothetical protein